MKKILLLHISQYGGHKKASENIEEALRYRNPDIEIKNINGFGYVAPRMEKLIDFFYMLTIKYAPFIWGTIYDRKSVIKTMSPLRGIVNRFAIPKLLPLIEEFRPDIILATQAFPCLIVAEMKKKYKLNIPLVAVVTDYYPHRFWIHPEITTYSVACDVARGILISEGVPEEKIKILGIPISYQFTRRLSREGIAREFGFALDIETVMIMGGGLGIGPIKQIIQRLEKSPRIIQLIVVCGRNAKLYAWIKKQKFKKKIFAYGYVDFINKLMDFSDILITKGGGLTVSEALVKGIATLVVNPIPGQEDRNVCYLEDKQAIIRVTNLEKIIRQVNMLLDDVAWRERLTKSARQIALDEATIKLADFVLEGTA